MVIENMKKNLLGNMKKSDKRNIIGTFVFLFYFFATELQALPFWILGINTETLPMIVKVIYTILFQVGLISVIAYVFRKDLKRDLKDLKKNHESYFKEYLKYWFIALGLMMVSNLIIIMLNSGDIANNEELIREMFDETPIYTFISAVLIAPLLEELVFRKSFRYMFNNDTLFIIMSGLVFGAFHVIGSFETAFDLIYIIPYSIPGLVFAYTLVKSKNIFVPIGLHFLHNGILMSLQFLLMFFS